MYWIPLLGLSAFLLAQKLRRVTSAFVGIVAVLALLVMQFATQFNTRYFAEWAYCAAGRDMMAAIRNSHVGENSRPVELAASWQLEPVINYYRAAWGLTWINPVDRSDPDFPADYYLLGFGDVALVEQRGLKTVLKDSLSGTVLARR